MGLLPESKICKVMGCLNHSDHVSFEGAYCMPCADFIFYGKRGTSSQAEHNFLREKAMLEQKLLAKRQLDSTLVQS